MPSEADALRDKTVEGSDQTRRGVSAIFKPKRKRAYWRALKQGKMWAVVEKQFRDAFAIF